ncbi:odv-ec43 [Catopsilia pomona nucleopolyhedrovirus]|uniref:Odv-ec43 n=1 Tax=Catopsilia pomona nucleopolyhedrovirus TaxID=1850906 RepID=A0A172WZA5_9ABAC|nr:odv-ec43 [Catopsilia pomona nucleopolyhedrovirus]ANF29687.1 odv-ec43 [Catopsilia pomona nucleopolyhedrovirus]
MECPLQIKVCISDRFFAFPYNLVEPQNDVGNKLVENLIVYVPTDEDRHYVDKKQFKRFKSVLVYRHEHDVNIDSRSPKKTASATVVYWNPLVPITEIGAGETRVFSVLLTNNLFYCNTMIVHHENPKCPIEFTYPEPDMKTVCKSSFNNSIGGGGSINKNNITSGTAVNVPPPLIQTNLRPIACEVALSHFKELIENNDFLLCFNLETSTMVKILSLKRIFCIFQYRKQAARYVINLPHEEIDTLYNKLNWERTRRLMKGDVPSNCATVNRASLNYVKRAQNLLNIPDYSQTIVEFVKMFQRLIFPYQLVPNVLIKLNNLDQLITSKKFNQLEMYKKIRLFCKNDSIAITSAGIVPINMPDFSVNVFDYSDIANAAYINQVAQRVSTEGVFSSGITISPIKYNYFL